MGLKANLKDFMLTKHGTLIGIKPDWFGQNDFAPGLKLAPFDSFEDGQTMNTEEITGQTGNSTVVRGNVKTTAVAKPTWSQQAVFGELLEDYFKLILGGDDLPTPQSEFPLVAGATEARHVSIFRSNNENLVDIPYSTLWSGYYATSNDAVAYNNAILGEFGIEITKGKVTITPTFTSWYGIMNQPNPVRLESVDLTRLVKEQSARIYIAPLGTGLFDLYKSGNANDLAILENYYYPCATEAKINFNNNLTDNDCLGEDIGKGNSLLGAFTATADITTKWNEQTAKLISEFTTGKKHGAYVTSDLLFKEVLVVLKAKEIEKVADESLTESVAIYFPQIEMIDAQTPKGGTERKTSIFNFSLSDNCNQENAVMVDIITKTNAFAYATTKAEIIDGSTEPADITIKLMSPFNTPISNQAISYNLPGETAQTATTDTNGEITVEDIPPGEYEISVGTSDTIVINGTSYIFDPISLVADIWYGLDTLILAYETYTTV